VLDLTRGLHELSRSEQQWIRPRIDLVLLLRTSSHRGRPHEQGRLARSHTITGNAFDFEIGERLFIWGFRASVQYRKYGKPTVTELDSPPFCKCFFRGPSPDFFRSEGSCGSLFDVGAADCAPERDKRPEGLLCRWRLSALTWSAVRSLLCCQVPWRAATRVGAACSAAVTCESRSCVFLLRAGRVEQGSFFEHDAGDVEQPVDDRAKA
jgi:hypothetical protein